MATISIVIPQYGEHLDLLKPCIESIIKYTDLSDVEVIIVANGCTDDVKGYVNALAPKENFKLLWSSQALGYTAATNLGISESAGEYVVLLNNDTVLLPQERHTWINLLLEPFKHSPKMAVTGPMMSHCPYADRGFLIFFCVCIKKEVFKTIGLLDEVYSPGFGEDADFCAKAVEAGYEIAQVPADPLRFGQGKYMLGSFPIYHIGEGTFDGVKEFQDVIQKNRITLMNRFNKSIRLNLGCGGAPATGYLNVDLMHPAAELRWDARTLPLNDNSVDEILVSHLLEHFDPREVSKTLEEWHRVLKVGGKLTIKVPDMEVMAKHFIDGDKQERYKMLNYMYSTATPESVHRFGWYWDILIDHIAGARFSNAIRYNSDVYNLVVECYKMNQNLPDGFFADHDIKTYRDLISLVPDGGTIAELGSWKGRSLSSVADLIQKKNIKVFVIDTFAGTVGEGWGGASNAEAVNINLRQVFDANMEKAGLKPAVIQNTTHNASEAFADQFFDFVFIDADHSYEGAKLDMQDWWPKVKHTGILAGHDIAWKGVADAVQDEFGMTAFTNQCNIWWVDRHRVYDCFMFSDELDLLEIRLNELDKEVDYFVLVEGTETFAGKPKPLHFDLNKKRFEKFLPKIRHIIVSEWPEYVKGDPDSAWKRERKSRDACMQGIQDARSCDAFIFGDADEIPSASAVRSYKKHMGIAKLEMNFYYYCMNYLSSENGGKWGESKMTYAANFNGHTPCEIRYTNWNAGGKASGINADTVIKNGGWHFSFLGGVDGIIKKIESYAHQECNTPEIKNRERIADLINQGKDIFGRSATYSIVPIDSSYPDYLLKNMEKFAYLIMYDGGN